MHENILNNPSISLIYMLKFQSNSKNMILFVPLKPEMGGTHLTSIR